MNLTGLQRSIAHVSLLAMALVTALLICTAPSSADVQQPPEKQAIRLPTGPLMPPSAGPVKLTKGVQYIIDSDVECIIREHPKGYITVGKKTGPRDMSAVFVDGSGEEEDRHYKGPFIYPIKAAATGRVEIDIIPVGITLESQIRFVTIDADTGQAPRPPPGPVDPPPQPPMPKVDPINPPPIPGDGLRVLLIYDRNEALPQPQAAIATSADIRDYARANFAKGPDGTPELRIYPKDANLATERQIWRDAFARPRVWKSPTNNDRIEGYTPWAIVSNGKTGYEGPWPPDVPHMIELFKKYK